LNWVEERNRAKRKYREEISGKVKRIAKLKKGRKRVQRREYRVKKIE